MNSKTNRRVAALGAVVILVAAAFFAWDWFFPPTAPTMDNASISGVIDSSAHVKATLAMNGQNGTVALHIGHDWHVNAHPASLDGLIASTVLIEHNGSQREAQADYPVGKSSGIVIDDANILVYEDGATIPVRNLAAQPGDRTLVRVQACNTQGICLAPATVVASDSPT